MRKNLLLIAGSLVVAVVLAEVVLRIVDPVRPADRVEFVVDEETYWRVRPSQSDPREPVVSVNAQGFRGVHDVAAKRDDRRRVFMLGDSYTWGFGVGDAQTYSSQLEQMSSGRLEVINGGTPGWGIFQFQVRLDRWIDRLEPDVVIVFVNTADILRQPYANEDAEREFLRRSAFRNAIRNTSKIVTVSVRLLERYRLQRDNRQVANAVPMDNAGGVRPGLYMSLLERDLARLAEMVELTRSRGAEFVLVAWPQRIPTTETFLTAMEAFAREHALTYIDMTSTLEGQIYEEYTLPYDHHPSAFGHQLVAERLRETIGG